MNRIIPSIIETTSNGERALDINSKLLSDRVVPIIGAIDIDMGWQVCAQLLHLESVDESKDICIYISSPGGDVTAGLAIFDTMRYIKCDISTVCIGMAASMGALLLASGTKGKRFCLPNSEVMIHQPLGGVSGQAMDIQIHANRIINTKKRLDAILSEVTGRSIKEIEKDTERDNFMNASEALAYGLIDEVKVRRK